MIAVRLYVVSPSSTVRLLPAMCFAPFPVSYSLLSVLIFTQLWLAIIRFCYVTDNDSNVFCLQTLTLTQCCDSDR